MTRRPLTDTSAIAAQVQLRVLRALPAPRRLALAIEMSTTARAFAAARLREQHPDWSESQITRGLLRLTVPIADMPPILS